MTAQTTDVYPGNVRPEDSDVIDLRQYLLVLIAWWREILLISILAGVLSGLALMWLNNQKEPIFEANADILIARILSSIELDERVSTTAGANQADPNGWRISLVQLADSSVVANQVLEELGDELPAIFQSPQALTAMISASNLLSPDERFASNIIRITAASTDPAVSAMVANSWARHFVTYVNGLYGEVPESVIESVTAEQEQVLADYQAAEKAYEDFVANNQMALLTRQIQEKTSLREGIMMNYATLVTAVVNTEYAADVNLYSALANANANHAAAVVAAQSTGTLKSLDRLYSLSASARAQLNQARIMERTLVEAGDAAAKSNTAALQLLKLAVFATLYGDEVAPTNLAAGNIVPAVEMSLEEQLADVRALAAVLEEYVAELESEIEQLASTGMIGTNLAEVAMASSENSQATDPAAEQASEGQAPYSQLLGPNSILNQAPEVLNVVTNESHEQMLTDLESEIRTLQAALSAEEAKQRELTHRRDLAWTTYETVGAKVQELSLLRSSANSEVRLGNPATVPSAPQAQDSSYFIVVAITALAFFGMALLALLVNALGGQPLFARRTT